MLAPTNRLLWLTFWLVIPALTLTGLHSSRIWLLVPAFTAVAAFDAYRLKKLLDAIQVSTANAIPAYKDRRSAIPVTVTGNAHVELGLPASFHWEHAVGSEIAFTPAERGEFLIDEAYLSAFSPSRMWRMRVRRKIELKVAVFPDLSRDPASRKLFATMQQGQRVQRLIGRGREVERLREYAAGDSFDEVYWKATARRGSPVSKVFQVERTQDIYAVVDGSRLGCRNQALERFVTASLLLAIAAEKNSDHFGLLTFSDRVHEFVRAGNGKGHFHRCRQAIFDLQPSPVSPNFAELFTFINLRIRKRALLFFLTDLSDPLLSETFARDASFIARRHIVVVNQIADAGDRPLFTGMLPETDSDVQNRLAGHLQWTKLRELEKSLSRIGVRMHLLKPDQTSTELLGQYMTIKQRQLL